MFKPNIISEKFRHPIRSIFFKLQDLCYSNSVSKKYDFTSFSKFATEIDIITLQILNDENFSNFRKLISNFEKEINAFEAEFNSLSIEILNEMADQIKAVANVDENAEIPAISRISAKSSTEDWKFLMDKFSKQESIKNDSYRKQLIDVALSTGISISTIIENLKNIHTFYSSLPLERTKKELMQENEKLREQVTNQQNEISQLKKVNTSETTENIQLKKKIETLTSEIGKMKIEKAIVPPFSDGTKELNKELSKLKDLNKRLDFSYTAEKEKSDEYTKKIEKLKSKLHDLKKENQKMKSMYTTPSQVRNATEHYQKILSQILELSDSKE